MSDGLSGPPPWHHDERGGLWPGSAEDFVEAYYDPRLVDPPQEGWVRRAADKPKLHECRLPPVTDGDPIPEGDAMSGIHPSVLAHFWNSAPLPVSDPTMLRLRGKMAATRGTFRAVQFSAIRLDALLREFAKACGREATS